jgi:hypothetical protein
MTVGCVVLDVRMCACHGSAGPGPGPGLGLGLGAPWAGAQEIAYRLCD